MKVLQVRLDDADHARMKDIADAAGISVSEQVRVWINNKPTPALDTAALVDDLRAEVKALKRQLAARPQPIIKGDFPTPKVATQPIREPMLKDREDSPFVRTPIGSFGHSRPAPKPSARK
jgi:hypothetical protein